MEALWLVLGAVAIFVSRIWAIRRASFGKAEEPVVAKTASESTLFHRDPKKKALSYIRPGSWFLSPGQQVIRCMERREFLAWKVVGRLADILDATPWENNVRVLGIAASSLGCSKDVLLTKYDVALSIDPDDYGAVLVCERYTISGGA